MRSSDLLITAVAPLIWGSTYMITTTMLPEGYPITLAALRALPAGLLLLAFSRRLPRGHWWVRSIILGGLNFGVFWPLLFVAAYRLPGGVAATMGAIQPLVVIALSRVVLGTRVVMLAVIASMAGLGGVALLLVTPGAELDPIGVAAAIGGTVAMATGTVLSRHWQPPVSITTFTAWQLTAGGTMLSVLALLVEPPLPALDVANVAGITYLSLFGAALTFLLWQRGIAKLPTTVVSTLGFLSPLMAVALGWVFLDQILGPTQWAGALIVLLSVWLCQWAILRAENPKQFTKELTHEHHHLWSRRRCRQSHC